MKIHVVIPCWRRMNITKKCFHAMKRLIKESKHEYEVTCVISEPEYIDLCKSFGFGFFAYKNNPLGEKINAGIQKALESEFDYLMIMNSDSMVNAKLIDQVYDKAIIERKPFIGIRKIYFADSESGEARVVEYNMPTVLGVAKMIRRDVIVAKLYNEEIDRGLDDHMMDVLIRNKHYPTILDYDEPLAVDVKSEVNIWPFEYFRDKGEEVSLEYLSTFFKELRCFCRQVA